MKPFSILIFLLLWISNESLGQNLNVVRNLGKLNFADSSNLVLSATVESGKYTYKLTDAKDPETPIFSFALVSNSIEVFKASIKENIAKSIRNITVDDQTLEKYFFYFENQNPFLIEDIPGGMAMEMVFSDSLTIYNFKHNSFKTIDKNDVYDLLNSLLGRVKPKEDFDQYSFDYAFYDTIKIKIDKVNTHLFNEEFAVKLLEIKNGSPKNLRSEELYKEIQYRYYKALINYVEKVVSEKKHTSKKNIKEIQEEISALQSKNRDLIIDTSSLKKEIREKVIQIENSKLKVFELNNRIQSDLELYNFSENSLPDDQILREQFNLAFTNNLTLARSLGDRFRIIPRDIENVAALNSLDLEALVSKDLVSVQQKASDLRELNLENLRIQELEGSINQNLEKFEIRKSDLVTIENDLKNNSKKINELQSDVLAVIKSQLESLKNSNKFHFKPREVQLEFNRGYLENIVVVGEATIFIEPKLTDFKSEIPFPALTLKFVNDYPIGISAKRDLELLGDIKLYARFQDDVHYEMRIGDLITNIKEILALDRTDYSPEDGIVTVNLLTEKKKDLKKSSTKEILQLKVFSDFVGLQEENPNGLIQFEVDKEIPLITKRSTKPYFGPIRFLVNKGGNIGYLNFIKPRFIYSKIEENNSSLEPESISVATENDTVQMFGTSALEIKQFERFSIGTDLNLLLYNIPYGKSTFLVNAGMHFGRTDFAAFDTVPELKTYPRAFTNTYQPSFELLWRITGDERYGLEFSYGINWIISDRQDFAQISNTLDNSESQVYKVSDTQYGIQRFMILAYLNIDPKTSGRLFFRYRSNSELWNFENNYSQLQIGYTTYLTKKSQ